MAFNVGNRKLRVALGVGHANSSGGNAYELGKNREVVLAILRLAGKSDGFDIRVWTPDNGRGMFPGPLDAAAATVRTWVQQGWLPDIVHELHHEGTGTPAINGGFIIYPDSHGLSGRKASGGDFTDIDAREAGPQMAKIIAAEIGNSIRGGGIMSERSTGVGAQGWRLGFFGAVSDPYFQNNAVTFISEAATYTNPGDRKIMDTPGFADREALGVLKAYAHLAKSRGGWTYSYKIGGASPSPSPSPAPKPGEKDVFDNMSNAVAARLFGKFGAYEFDAKGVITNAWADWGKKNGVYPKLADVWESGGERLFAFSNGLVLVYNTKSGKVRVL